MVILRIIGVVIPQILVLLVFGAQLDLLGGWNNTNGAFLIVIVLFLLSPIVTATLLISETVKYWKQKKSRHGTQSLLMFGLAVFFFVEALVIDSFILSQLRM